MQYVIENFRIAGVAIGIIKSGEVIYMQGFGVRHLDIQEPITPRSLFHVGRYDFTVLMG